jgi:5-methylthioribose kinase
LFELTLDNAGPYLARALGGNWLVSALGGGVSNTTLLAESGSRRIVVKQSLPQLRVAEVWYADRNRIHNECESIRRLGPLLGGAVPRVVHEDRANCIFTMEAASPAARDWKTLLLAGEMDDAIAARAGEILATQIRGTCQSEEWRNRFGGLESFEQLRLDPYYAFTPRFYPELKPYFDACTEQCRTRRVAAVHGDFSPKNILVDPGAGTEVILIDFEVIHFGDPSFDAAFLLNHLLLKARHRPDRAARLAELAAAFWQALTAGLPPGLDWFETSTIAHLGCLHLARADGKSPAEYLGEAGREHVRQAAKRLILDPPRRVLEAFV